jgi:hypothetical protein
LIVDRGWLSVDRGWLATSDWTAGAVFLGVSKAKNEKRPPFGSLCLVTSFPSLPDLAGFFADHGARGFAVECGRELGHVRERAVHTPTGQRVRAVSCL